MIRKFLAKFAHKAWLLTFALCAVVVMLPFLDRFEIADVTTAWPYFLHLMILITIYIILAASLNLITGFTGLLNLGHAAFYAIGAYTFALLMLKNDIAADGWVWVAFAVVVAATYLVYKVWNFSETWKPLHRNLLKVGMIVAIPVVLFIAAIVGNVLGEIVAGIVGIAPFFARLLLAGLFAGYSGFLVGIPSLRLRGDYLAIATLGFGEIIRAGLINETWLTRGPLGLPGIPRPLPMLDENEMFFVYGAILVIVTYFVVRRLAHSSFGRVLKAVREDEIAAQALGKDVNKYKLLALSVGAFFAGIAGSMFAAYITFIDPSTFVLSESVIILAMVVLGGLGSLQGSVIGATILVLLPEPLRKISTDPLRVQWIIWLLGIVLAVVMIYLIYKAAKQYRQRLHTKEDVAVACGAFIVLILLAASYLVPTWNAALNGLLTKWFTSGFAQLRVMVYSVLLIVMMIYRPQGLIGEIEILKK